MCKINVARTVTHAIVQHWITNLITPFQWFYAWINQGIFSLLAADIINKVFFLYV